MKKQKKNSNRSAPSAKGYSESGASTTRRALKSFTPNSGAPSEDINRNNSSLRQRSRMLYMSSPVATSAINTNRTKVVGIGLTLKSSINNNLLGISADDAKVWQRTTEAEFRLWAGKKQNCDAIGMNNFECLQQLTIKSWLMSGDVFAVIKRYDPTMLNPYSLRVHLVEADRVSTPSKFIDGYSSASITEGRVPENNPGAGNKIYDGVEINANGQIVAYYICSTYPNQFTSEPTTWQRVEAYGSLTGMPNILQVSDSERADQYRGVPYLAQVIEPLLQLRRYTESELMAALVQSFFTAWIETKTDPTEIPLNEASSGDVPGETPDEVSESQNEYEMGPGTVTHLEPDETVQFGNPNIPTAGFDSFVKRICQLVGAALEIPYDVLIKEFNSSYSASRGALLEAWEAVKMRRAWLVGDFCQPIYELWLAEAVALGRIKAPGFFDDPRIREAWCGARWIGPVQGQLDPRKEVDAAIQEADKGIKTYEQITRELGGGDWEENIEQLKLENEKLRAAGCGTATIIAADPADPNDPD